MTEFDLPVVQEDEQADEWFVDRGLCPYFRGEGTCMGGCVSEPSCITDRPADGWPSERPAAAISVIDHIEEQ
jgi:hypothetical protein